VRKAEPPKPWHGGKPPSGKRRHNDLLKYSQSQKIYPRRPKKAWHQQQQQQSPVQNGDSGPHFDSLPNRSPKKVKVFRNGDPGENHVLLLNRRTAQSFEHVLDDLSGMFSFQCAKLYTQDGKPVSTKFSSCAVEIICSRKRLMSQLWFKYILLRQKMFQVITAPSTLSKHLTTFAQSLCNVIQRNIF
jgi:hypothetical protein